MHRLQSRRARVLPLPTKCLLYHEKRAMDKLKAWRDAQWWRGVRADDGWARGYGGGKRDYGRGGYAREAFFGFMR
jgi:hypothetical protein